VISRSPWFRIIIEGIVIVGSILLAFGIDAWWNERQQREEERRLLRNIHEDFTETRVAISDALEVHRQIRDDALELLEFGQSADSRPPEFPSAGRLTRVLFGVITTFPKTGALDGAMASGRLDLVTNEDLRFALAEWPATLHEFSEQQDWTWDLVVQARQQLNGAASISEIVPVFGVPAPALVYSPDLIAYFRSSLGRNYMALRAQAEGFSVRDGEALVIAVDSLLVLLDSEAQ
jgi:hypothetical protein